jgi:1-acyl-sn-glycerol-3-phosphate acyltransferase
MQRGAALIVRRADVPIVPAVIVGSFEAWPKNHKVFRARPVRVMYGPPLDVAGLKGDQIIALIDGTLRKMFSDLRAGRVKQYER